MEITKKEVERISQLARIELSEKEKEKMAQELASILGYIDSLKEVGTEGVEPIAHITGLENVLRPDVTQNKSLEDQAAEANKLVDMVPDKKDNFIKVKEVFGK